MQININIAEQHQEPPVIMEMMRQMQVQQNKTCEKWLKVRNGCLYNKIPEILGVSATGTLIDAMTTGSWQLK